jgi:hypothetical protein
VPVLAPPPLPSLVCAMTLPAPPHTPPNCHAPLPPVPGVQVTFATYDGSTPSLLLPPLTNKTTGLVAPGGGVLLLPPMTRNFTVKGIAGYFDTLIESPVETMFVSLSVGTSGFCPCCPPPPGSLSLKLPCHLL